MSNYFTTDDGKSYLEIKISSKGTDVGGKKDVTPPFVLSEKLKNGATKETGHGPVNVYAFRIVYTAGFALPIAQLIMASNDRKDLEQFKEGSIVDIVYGDPTMSIGILCKTVGYHIKQSPIGDCCILNWGGVFIPPGSGNLDMSFLQDVMNSGKGAYEGRALDVLKEAWEQMYTKVEADDLKETTNTYHSYRVWKNLTPQNFLVDVFLHVDLRPSFPMAYINEKGNLVLKDFQKMISKGPSAIFIPNDEKTVSLTKEQKTIKNIIKYSGKPEAVSHRTYVNRNFGYSEISVKDIKSGKYFKFGSDVMDTNEDGGISDEIFGFGAPRGGTNTFSFKDSISKLGAKLKFGKKNKNSGKGNTCASGEGIEGRKEPTIKDLSEQLVINTDTPKAFHEVCKHNTKNLVNMSAVQLQLRVPEQYIGNIKVLDLVEVEGAYDNASRISGYWVVEAIEHGFFNGKTINIVYLCRDYLNNEENRVTVGAFADALWNKLGLTADNKEFIANLCQDARGALSVCRGVLDNTYINEVQAYLINMKASALSNFGIFGSTINLGMAQSSVYSLRATAEKLGNTLVCSFIGEPYSTFFMNVIGGGGTVFNFILLLLQSILGGSLFNAFYGLFCDLRAFSIFLNNYNSVLASAIQESNPGYTTSIIEGTISFTENPDGTLNEVVESKNVNIPTRSDMTKQTQEEVLSDLKQDVTEDIQDMLPEDVDIPVPDIQLDEDDLVKDREEVVEKVVDATLADLFDRGYVFDEDLLDEAVGDEEPVNYNYKETGIATTVGGETKITAQKLKKILLGEEQFTAQLAKVLKNTVSNTIKVRHWGTYVKYDDLTSFNINDGYVDRYKTVNAVKFLTCKGQRVWVALPAEEKDVKFYINSERSYEMEQNIIEVSDLGYTTASGKPIPYVIYYTNEYYDTVRLTLEMRK